MLNSVGAYVDMYNYAASEKAILDVPKDFNYDYVLPTQKQDRARTGEVHRLRSRSYFLSARP